MLGIVGKDANLRKTGFQSKSSKSYWAPHPTPNQLVLARSPRLGPVTGCWVWERGLCCEDIVDRQEFQIFIFGSKCPPTTATTITAITTTIFFFTTITIAFTTSEQHSQGDVQRKKSIQYSEWVNFQELTHFWKIGFGSLGGWEAGSQVTSVICV